MMTANRNSTLIVAGVSAFCTYFCMYAFRRPFTAGTFDDQDIWGLELKSTLVISQLLGYMLSKFIGIKVVSEMPARHRGLMILSLIGVAELALIGFAVLPLPLKVVMLFLNGLPLGMVFGLVLAYLEGRRMTEAMSAILCASFIISSGVVKSIGRWLVEDLGFSEFSMPMVVGLCFLPPLFFAVWLLQKTPPPDAQDRTTRTERKAMSGKQRRAFLAAYWPGLTLLILVYVMLTILRTARDDFGVELWRDLGVSEKPQVFAQSETLVALFVTALSALAIWIPGNLAAIRVTFGMMCTAFVLVAAASLGQGMGYLSPMPFMVACGIGLYLPYVAFHTTVFERLIAAAKRPGNLGFLMYLADSIGYLGYSAVLVVRNRVGNPAQVLPSFRWVLLVGALVSMLALLAAAAYFQRSFTCASDEGTDTHA